MINSYSNSHLIMESDKQMTSSETVKTSEEKIIFEYKKEHYDITKFVSKHPGGINTINGKSNMNIELSLHDHSKAAKYLLKSYKVETKKHDLDESMEHLVDWNAAMIKQISGIGSKYHAWVNLPVDRELRLFENQFLESLSKTPWYLPPLVWIPVMLYLIVSEMQTLDEKTNKSLIILINLSIGTFIWSLLEYTLHRYLFHIDVERFPHLSTFHFLIHGLHHKVPFDENRLVFPPVPAFILATILYQPFLILNYCGVLSHPRLMLAGGLLGYLCYDMIHYYLHYGSPSNKVFLYDLKRYHYNHHFVNHDKGFGISNTFWDGIFGSKIIMKKLKYVLQWRL